MAIKAYYLLPAVVAAGASKHRDLQDGGGAPAAATSGTGWNTGTIASGYSLMFGGVERSRTTFAAPALPSANPVDFGVGDCFRSPSLISGTMAAGNVSAAFPVIAVSLANTGTGRMQMRCFKSKSLTGNNTTLWKLTDTVAAGAHAITRNITAAEAQDITVQAIVQAGTLTNAVIVLGGSTTFIGARYDLSAVTVPATTSGGGAGESIGTTSITALGGGFYRIRFTGRLRLAGGGSSIAVNIYPDDGTSVGSYTGTGTGTIYVTGAMAETGSSMSSYEQTHGAAGDVNLLDYSEALNQWSLTQASIALDGSADNFAYSVTELTSGASAGSTVNNVTTGTEQVSTVTAAVASRVLDKEFLFFQCAWQIQTASGGNNADVNLRRNSTGIITTPDISNGIPNRIVQPKYAQRRAAYN